MKASWWWSGIATLGLLAAIAGGCSKKETPSENSAGSASGGSAGNGGANAGGNSAGGSAGKSPGISGPAITEAPPAWVRPADCHGIGNLCPNLAGCEMGSVCQLEGNVCIPAYDPNAGMLPSKSMERPYCAAYTCMTFEEASCFCTGEAGESDSRCESPAALAGLCQAEGWSCGADKTCCDGTMCVTRSKDASGCEKPCETEADCESGCCTDRWDTGIKICAEMDACTNPCKKRGEACMQGSETTPNNCCRGSCLESDDPDVAGCRPTCDTAADCPETGCCMPFSNVDYGYCAEPIYCSCLALGDTCGPEQPVGCCDGTRCAGNPDDGFTCRQECTQNTDCPSSCCRPISDGSYSICSPTEQCPPM
jgi:hypothetical protein